MKTKLFTLFTALFFSAQCFAWDITHGAFYYEFLGGDSVAITSFMNTGDVAELMNIPDTIIYLGQTFRVTAIGDGAFSHAQFENSVLIPSSINRIGREAFCGCRFTSITIPENVTLIGDRAFYNLANLTSVVWNAKTCTTDDDYYGLFAGEGTYDYETGEYYPWESQVTSFTFGNNVTTIPACICKNLSKLTKVTIPNSVTNIGENAFNGAGVTSLTIPENVAFIGDRAFYNLANLTSVVWNAKDYIQSNDDDYYYSSEIFGGAGTYDESTGQSYKWESKVTSFTFGNNVKTIPSGICAGMSKLASVTIPNSVTTIGQSAFDGCSGISSLTVPANVTTVAENAFYDMVGLTSVVWNAINSNPIDTEYYSPMFAIRSENAYSYSDSNPYITSVTFGSNVETIPAGICHGLVNLKNITLPTTVKTIGHDAFNGCESLENIIFPRAVKTIGYGAFSGCKMITTIDIPNSVTTIDVEAFAWCSSLTSAVLGDGVKTIGDFAFYGCNQMTKFICNSLEAVEESDYFDYAEPNHILCCTQLDTIIAPANIFDKPEPTWSTLAKNVRYIQVNGGELTSDAFAVINRSYKTLQHLDVAAASNTEIADEAFKGCYSLQQLQLPTQLENIGYMAFAECKSLKAIEIPSTVVSIGNSAFEDCRSIASIAFESNTALQNIGSWAFYNCHELKQLAIPEGVTEVGAAAFYGCVYLEELTLPSTVQSIGDNCFAFCSKLNKITSNAIIPPSIDAKTFYEVKRSTPVYVPANSLTAYEDDIYWSEFFNILAPGETTDISSITSDNTISTNKKVFENGTIYILKPNGDKYTIDGRKVN